MVGSGNVSGDVGRGGGDCGGDSDGSGDGDCGGVGSGDGDGCNVLV